MRRPGLSRRRFLAQCLAGVPAARAGLLAAQDTRRAPRGGEDARRRDEPVTLAQIGDRLRATYPDLSHHFVFEYYPWYGTNPWAHWDADGRRPPGEIASSYLPALGPYDSQDRRVIEQHAKWITAAGVGAINLSWWGRGSNENAGVHTIMDVMRAFGIQVTFHLEPYQERTQNIVDDVKYLLREYGERRRWDAFLLVRHADGSAAPAMKLFESIMPETTTDCRGIVHKVPGYVPDPVWRVQTQRLRQEIRTDFPKFMLIADTLSVDRAIAGGFDGGTSADPYFRVERWDEVAFNFNARGLPFMFAANAGFDGVPPKVVPDDPCYRPSTVEPSPDVDWTSEASRQREHEASAARIRQSFEKTVRLQTSPASANLRKGFFLVYVNSFNEWHEGTMFEPTASYTTLSAAERRIYHNAVSGAYRLETLQTMMAQVL